MDMFAKNLILFLVIVLCDSAFGCNGYKARIIKSVSCAGDSSGLEVADSPQFDVDFNEHCELVAKGCFITVGFESGKGTLRLEKHGTLIQEDALDLCASGGCSKNNDKHCPTHVLMDLYDIRILLFNYRSPFILKMKANIDHGEACQIFTLDIYK